MVLFPVHIVRNPDKITMIKKGLKWRILHEGVDMHA